ncbi:hypothetical protein NUW54_g801 [Trametes sanguinea]|uniref:Uncharacterized protein n=1 Tax=Trametes sanguinea TaxID=158606 RepID=A0ACC1Q869_9APHY|nr:hypothetical protein NUW54_g801 [Trametes sanguinea]
MALNVLPIPASSVGSKWHFSRARRFNAFNTTVHVRSSTMHTSINSSAVAEEDTSNFFEFFELGGLLGEDEEDNGW